MTSSRFQKIADTSNVLLITSDYHLESEIRQYFKNVLLFNSSIKAAKYFESHPYVLRQFQIILYGNNDIDKAFNEKDNPMFQILTQLSENNINDRQMVKVNFGEEEDKSAPSIITKATSIAELFSEALVLKLDELTPPKLPDYKESIKYGSLPESVKDCRVLWIAKDMQLGDRIHEFLKDNYDESSEYVECQDEYLPSKYIDRLGDYDIIISDGKVHDLSKEIKIQEMMSGKKAGLIIQLDNSEKEKTTISSIIAGDSKPKSDACLTIYKRKNAEELPTKCILAGVSELIDSYVEETKNSAKFDKLRRKGKFIAMKPVGIRKEEGKE